MSNRASVLQPGLQTTVQDYPGRVGHWRVGIPPSGPMDSLAFRLANLLVGNSPGAAALEMQFTGPTLRFETAATIALTGGDCGATLAGAAVPHWRSLDVAAGQELRCPALRSGARAYLAIRGGIEKDPVLGSRATFPRGGVGGEALAAGASLGWPDTDRPRHGWRVAPGRIPAYASEIEVALTDGLHVDWLDEAGRAIFLGAAWKVSGSIRYRMSPSLTTSPSLNRTASMNPVIRARISTRPIASTRPTNSVARVIGFSSAATVPTGMAVGCCADPWDAAATRKNRAAARI